MTKVQIEPRSYDRGRRKNDAFNLLATKPTVMLRHHQRWSREQRLEAKAKTQKKSEAKAKHSSSEDRPSRGQGQECSKLRPRTKDTGASVLLKKIFFKNFFKRSPKKRASNNFFKRSPKKRFSN